MSATSAMFDQMNWLDTHNATSSPALESGATRYDSPSGQTIAPSGPAHVRVNLSARQASAGGLLTSGTYGRRGSISSSSAALSRSLVSRLRQTTALLGSTLFDLTWKVRRTPSGAPIYALRASARRVSDSDCSSWPTPTGDGRVEARQCVAASRNDGSIGDSSPGELANPSRFGHGKERPHSGRISAGDQTEGFASGSEPRVDPRELGDSNRVPGRGNGGAVLGEEGKTQRPLRSRSYGSADAGAACELGIAAGGGRARLRDKSAHREPLQAGPVNGFWSDAEWIYCRDEKWRPVEPGSFPLVDGAAARVVRLRGYGNAINAEVAAEFIRSYEETRF